MNSYVRGNEHIYITYLPDLKKPILAIGNGIVIRKIASFDNKEYAEIFSEMLGKWFGCKEDIIDENNR